MKINNEMYDNNDMFFETSLISVVNCEKIVNYVDNYIDETKQIELINNYNQNIDNDNNISYEYF